MATIAMSCIDKGLTITDIPLVDITGTNTIQFSFCPKWEGYTKSVVFYKTPSLTYTKTVVDDAAEIPSEVVSEGSCFTFVVRGSKDGAEDRETQFFRCRMESGELIVENPTESIREIFSKRIADLEGWVDDVGYISTSDIDEMMGG